MQQTPQVNAAASQPPRRKPLPTLLWTWGIMAMAALPLGWMICAAGGTPAWHAWLVTPVTCLAGPISFLLRDLEAAPYVGLYGLSVAWLFWKPSGWSKAVFILFSVLWLFFGCAVACIPF